jgi:ankyrin repeat protein
MLAWATFAQSAFAQGFHTAVRDGNLDRIQMLLQETPAALHSTNRDGSQPLPVAVRTGNIDAVRLLLNNGTT